MTPADKIDAIIKERGLSRRQVAIKAQIPPSTFQSAMERKKNISTDMLKKVATVLNVSLSDLLWEGEGPVPDDVSILMVGPQGAYIVDSDRRDKVSLRKIIADNTKILVGNLKIAEMDDLWGIYDHIEKCIDILKKRKKIMQKDTQVQKNKAPDGSPEP